MKIINGRLNMPLVKVIRNGQITIPKKFRSVFDIEEGDFLEIEIANSGMLIKPKAVVDKAVSRRRLGRLVKEMQGKVIRTGLRQFGGI